jgi:hypothetical protein
VSLPARREDRPGQALAAPLAVTGQGTVASVLARAEHCGQDHAEYASDHLRLQAMAARVPEARQAEAQALLIRHMAADRAGLASVYLADKS